LTGYGKIFWMKEDDLRKGDLRNRSGERVPSREEGLTVEQAEQIWEAVLALPRGGCLPAFFDRFRQPKEGPFWVSFPNIPEEVFITQFVKNPGQAELQIRYSDQGEPVSFELDLTHQTRPHGKQGARVILTDSPLSKVRAIIGERNDEGYLIQAEYETDEAGRMILTPKGRDSRLEEERRQEKKGLTFDQATDLLSLLKAPSGS